RRRHTRSDRDWSSDACSSDLADAGEGCALTLQRKLHRVHLGIAVHDAQLLPKSSILFRRKIFPLRDWRANQGAVTVHDSAAALIGDGNVINGRRITDGRLK